MRVIHPFALRLLMSWSQTIYFFVPKNSVSSKTIRNLMHHGEIRVVTNLLICALDILCSLTNRIGTSGNVPPQPSVACRGPRPSVCHLSRGCICAQEMKRRPVHKRIGIINTLDPPLHILFAPFNVVVYRPPLRLLPHCHVFHRLTVKVLEVGQHGAVLGFLLRVVVVQVWESVRYVVAEGGVEITHVSPLLGQIQNAYVRAHLHGASKGRLHHPPGGWVSERKIHG